MRVAFVAGLEPSTIDLANQLTRMGHEAIVLAESNGASSSYAHDGAWVRTAAADELTDALREESTDIVHVIDPARLPQALDAAEQLGLPVVAQIADSGDAQLLARAAAVVEPSRVPALTEAPPSLEEEAWTIEGVYTDCLVNARA